jgi:hypothetical protein
MDFGGHCRFAAQRSKNYQWHHKNYLTFRMLSRIVYFISIFLIGYTSFFFYPRWQKGRTEATISWDVSGYYWYLPSVFIYHDLRHQSFKDGILEKYGPTNDDFQQGIKVENGNYVMKYSSGMALMYLPFFTLAHMLAGPLGYPPDGFSTPYQLGIQLGGFLMAILGLWYLRKLLLLFYDDRVVAVVIFLLVAGSNYLVYSAIDAGMSHSWLFTIYVFILLNTFYFYKDFKIKYAIRLGLLIGLATLTRPTEIISCLIPLLWGVETISIKSVKDRFMLILGHYRAFIMAAILAVLVISVQLLYWKYVSGHWIVYSYSDQGFYWTKPHFSEYTFSYKSGWLVYTPMMFFAFIGIIPFIRIGRNKVAILTFFILNYYLVSAWDIWWYGGRAMVQSYPILLFPLATLVNAAFSRKIVGLVFAPFALLFLYFNFWIIVQSHGGGLYDNDCMTKKYFWRVAGRWSAPESTLVLRDNTDLFEQQPSNMKLIYQNNFALDTASFYVYDSLRKVNCLVLNKDLQNSPLYSFSYVQGNAKWMKAEATVYLNSREWDVWKMTQFVVRLIDKNKQGTDRIVKENMVRIQRTASEKTLTTVGVEVELPSDHFDSVNIFFWNADGDKEVLISNLKVSQFN